MSLMTKRQNERVVKLSAGDIRNNRFPLRGVIDLFPKSAIGGSSEAAPAKRMLVLEVAGLCEPVRTDIPSDAATGRPRSMFRRRGWVRQFYSANQLAAGDEVLVRSLGGFRFSIRAGSAQGNGNGQQLLGFRPPASRRSARRAERPYTFVDLFAGIGGFRIGMERAGMRCVFSSEWDEQCQKTYEAWFRERPHGDIREIAPEEIPDHDVLVGGFPCQPFSIAGVTKKNALGHAHGFLDETQGTLFFDIARIIESKRPSAFVLENVKNLRSHDKGKTWRVIYSTLSAMDYVLFDKIIDAAAWVPQHRERVFIVGFDRRRFGWNVRFNFPKPPCGPRPRFRDILENNASPKYTLTDHLWEYLQDYARKHAAKGNGFGFGMTNLDGVSRTMSARYYKDGAEILIPQGQKQNPRRLTPTEARRLMGFPDHLPVVVSDTQAYRQFGNAVVPKVVHAVGLEVVRSLNSIESPMQKRTRAFCSRDCPPRKGAD